MLNNVLNLLFFVTNFFFFFVFMHIAYLRPDKIHMHCKWNKLKLLKQASCYL